MTEDIEHPGPIAFDVICALPGFCYLTKRSSTLDGSLPLRAAQHCSPVVEGNAAGFQVVLENPITLRRIPRGGAEVELMRDTQDLLKHVPAALEQCIQAGVLERDGHWDRLLRRGEFPVIGGRLLLWSGFLVRPRSGVWLRVSPAFNRGRLLPVIEHLVADSSGFAPLLIELDLRLLPTKPLWLEEEIASVLPVSPKASMSLGRVTPRCGIVENFEDFYDAQYLAEKAQRPTGKYRKQVRDHGAGEASDICAAEAFFLGPDIHEVETLARFCTPAGFRKHGPGGESGFPVGVVRNVGRISFHWDGRAFSDLSGDFDRARKSFQRGWRRAGGRSRQGALLEHHLYEFGTNEPRWLLQSWVFVKTTPGWSTVTDGCQLPGSTGMRAVIRSDMFHSVVMVYHLDGPGTFSIPAGAPLLRYHPLPRSLQEARAETILL